MVRMLVIDDDEVDRRAVVRVARTLSTDIEVVSAANLDQALEAASTRVFDVVLLDMNLGGVRGEDVMASLRSTAPSLPIVLLTGTRDPDRIAAGMRAGAIDYIPKSALDADRLGSVLRALAHIREAEGRAHLVRDEEERHRTQLARLVEASFALAHAENLAEVAEATVAAVSAIFQAEGRMVLRQHDREVAVWPAAPLTEGQAIVAILPPSAYHLAGALEIRRPARELDPSERLIARHLKRVALSRAEQLTLLAEARASARERQEMVAIVSHDLRTPLQTFSMGLDAMALSRSQGNWPATEVAALRMTRAVRTMSRLLMDLLDVSRIQDGVLTVRNASESVAPLIDELRDLHLPIAEKQGLTLTTEVDPYLVLVCDSARLSQALGNVVSNALRHTRRGSIHITAKRLGDRARFEVTDTGAGIPPELHARLFERLFQGEASGRPGGLGLGLYIVKGIVDAHGGTVGCQSEVGRGTMFWLELPLAAAMSGTGTD